MTRWGKDRVWHQEVIIQALGLLVPRAVSYMKTASLTLCFHICRMSSIVKHVRPCTPSWDLVNTVTYRKAHL